MTTTPVSPLNPPKNLKKNHRQDWCQLHGSSPALVLSQVAQQQQHPVVVITPDSLSAQRLSEDIQFYTPKDLTLLTFPDWETLPYDVFSPHQDIVSERLTTLYHLPSTPRGILVLPVATLMHRLAPSHYVQANSLVLNTGQALQVEAFRNQLELGGYRCVAQVEEHGEFAVRGSIIDLFPMGNDSPYRIDLFDTDIDTIRRFDPETQRSQDTVKDIRLLPAREFPLTGDSINHFRNQWRNHFGGDPTRCPVYQDVSRGYAPAGIEYYLPLFFDHTHTLFDYLPASSLMFTFEGAADTAEQFWQETRDRYEQLRHDIERPILPPDQLFLQPNQLFAHLRDYPYVHLRPSSDKGTAFATQVPPELPVESRSDDPLHALRDFLTNFNGRVLLSAETTGRRETLLDLLRNHKLSPTVVDDWHAFCASDARFALTIAPLQQGLCLGDDLALICENQLFGERVAQRRSRKRRSQRDAENIVRDLTELNVGAPVVHEEHGVGRYLGLVTLELDGAAAEFLHLEYAKGDKLYVPVSSLHLISRYTGTDPDHAPLHRLGSGQWEKAKRKAAQKVTDVAAELLDIYARRAARQGHAFQLSGEDYRAFAASFPFEETPDQQDAIDAVVDDMLATQPMDRLVCGDVGFGKTEVAMRAAFIAVQGGKQVAVLVPTTLLAQQHYQNFLDRFADWPVKIEQLSRFRSKKQQDSALQQLADGHIDIVIGTHKLIQDNIQFKRLGLVIIDEEHRFGVKQKEKFKALRAEVDILTLTATPIPRSLNMALSNMRELSIIATPPSRRLAVKTFVKQWHDPLLSEAIVRELKRGGQVYFLHNDIETIEKTANTVEKLVPEARVHVAHGKLRERELEKVMQDFYHRRFNVLVCTTIIETGIDVPNANTIIINRADRFGLAQLYQLRGRVGRSHHRAYAYLLVPPKKTMTKDAVKRLDALSSIEELGMGFTLATHDLEIRGAGELLGDEQSGHMQAIGYSLYTEMLERAVQALKEGKQPELDKPLTQGTEIDLHSPALLPEDYIPDVHTRLILYKRLANATDKAQLDELHAELVDRFGLLPPPTKALLQVTELKLQATPLGIKKIDLGSAGGYILFEEQPAIDPMRIVQLVQMHPQRYKLEGSKLKLLWATPDFAARREILGLLLGELGENRT